MRAFADRRLGFVVVAVGVSVFACAASSASSVSSTSVPVSAPVATASPAASRGSAGSNTATAVTAAVTNVPPLSKRVFPAHVANQGVATVLNTDGRGTHLLTRGDLAITGQLRAQGWVHVGDPDSIHGYVLDAYQGRTGATSKMFLLTSPQKTSAQFVHTMVPGEMFNNSFAAIAPTGDWFVSGEWGTISRLLMFRMPSLGSASGASGGASDKPQDLPLAGDITLTNPMRNVQGCSFASDTELYCATNDPDEQLFAAPRQLLRLTLSHRLDGTSVQATPTLITTLPTGGSASKPAVTTSTPRTTPPSTALPSTTAPSTASSKTTPTLGEVEGIDVHDGVISVVVVSPSYKIAYVYTYHAAALTPL